MLSLTLRVSRNNKTINRQKITKNDDKNQMKIVKFWT